MNQDSLEFFHPLDDPERISPGDPLTPPERRLLRVIRNAQERGWDLAQPRVLADLMISSDIQDCRWFWRCIRTKLDTSTNAEALKIAIERDLLEEPEVALLPSDLSGGSIVFPQGG